MGKKFLFFNFIVSLLIVLFISCPTIQPGEENSTYTLSGTLNKTGVANGIFAYLKLVAYRGGPAAVALYRTNTTFSSETAAYSISGISTGNYTFHAFIDENGNADPLNPLPDAADETSDAINMSIYSNKILNVSTWY